MNFFIYWVLARFGRIYGRYKLWRHGPAWGLNYVAQRELEQQFREHVRECLGEAPAPVTKKTTARKGTKRKRTKKNATA